MLLHGPVFTSILRLAAPNFLLAAMQAAATFADAYYVGRLGTEYLAAIALVFPILALMQMMSAGAIGGGLSSAIARARGAGDHARAAALATQAIYLVLGFGLTFSVIMLVFGPALFRLLGAGGVVVDVALSYSNTIFAGACLIWLANISANILRGSGNMSMPAVALSLAAIVQCGLGAVLTLGLGPFPALGIRGTAIGYLAGFGFAGVVLGVACVRQVRRWTGSIVLAKPSFALLKDVLRVGLLSSLNAAQTVVTTLVVTGLVGTFGAAALAGYGVGARLELLQVPFVFAIGAALVAMVGVNVGAGNIARARRVAWTGGLIGAGITGTVGMVVAIWPSLWAGLFSDDAEVLRAGYSYLRTVGPCYLFFGAGLALYFASQGIGRVLGPVLSSTARLLVAALGGYVAVYWLGASLETLYVIIGVGLAVFGIGVAASVMLATRR
jgi:putative MATE family efflux protein